MKINLSLTGYSYGVSRFATLSFDLNARARVLNLFYFVCPPTCPFLETNKTTILLWVIKSLIKEMDRINQNCAHSKHKSPLESSW
jgi:hypothetical protein